MVLIGIGFFIAALNSKETYEMQAFFFLSFVFFIGGAYCYSILNKKLKEEQLKKEEAKQKELAELRKKAQMEAQKRPILKKLYANKIKTLDTPEQKTNALFIAKNFGMSGSDDEILDKLNSYLVEEKKKNEQKQQRKEQEKRQAMLKTYNREKKLAYIVGKDKYLLLLTNKIEQWQNEANKNHDSYKTFAQTANMLKNSTTKTVDPYIAGGLAQGLAGPAAGMLAALDAERQNQQGIQRDTNSQMILLQASNRVAQLEYKAQKYVKDLKDATRIVNEALFDESEPEKNFDQIVFETVKIESIAPNCMKLHISTSVPNQQKIINTPAQIDGSVRIVIVENGKDIGDAYYSAYGAGDNNLNNVGFASDERQQFYKQDDITAIPFVWGSFTTDGQYSLRIEPVHIWKIEGTTGCYWKHIQSIVKPDAYTYVSSDERLEVEEVWGEYCRGISYEMVEKEIDKLPEVNTTETLNIPPRIINNICS